MTKVINGTHHLPLKEALAHILTRTSWEDMYDFSCARRDPHKFLHLFPKFTCPIYMKVLYMEFKKVSKMLQESTNYLGDSNKRWNRPPDSNGRSHPGHSMAIRRPASSHAGRPEPATLVVIRERFSWAGALTHFHLLFYYLTNKRSLHVRFQSLKILTLIEEK